VLSSNDAPIVVPSNAHLDFGEDGSVSARVGEAPPENLGRLKMVSPDGENRLKRSDDGLFRPVNEVPMAADTQARVQGGALEGSNVNPIEAMVGMIAVSRQFELQMKMLQTNETNDKTASQLLSMNG
jgi:flagellar basal-body rod protein FlgF